MSYLNKTIFKTILPLFILLFTINACGTSDSKEDDESTDQSEALITWLNEVYEANLMLHPEDLTSVGRKERYSELNDMSEEFQLAKLEQAKKNLEELHTFDVDKLDKDSQLSYRIFEDELKSQIDYEKFRLYDYPVSQMHGIQAGLASFMLNKHEIENVADAEAYIARLSSFKTAIDQVIANLKIREDKGIIAPKFVFPHALSDCVNIMGDKEKLNENLFILDLKAKMEKANLKEEDIAELTSSASETVTQIVNPAYEKLIDCLTLLETKATTDDGVWKFPEGEEFYQYRLEKMTTTSLTGDEIFDLGKSEVARIHAEMQSIMDEVEFNGSLQDFFKFMKVDPQFYYPDTEAGKETMLKGYKQIIDGMELRLDEVFHTKPKAKMQVKAVEAWREKSAGKAFYEEGSPDGARKGTFYANL